LFFTCAFIFCSYMKDTIGINIKHHFDLRHTSGRGGILSRLKTPSVLLSFARLLSPCTTCICTPAGYRWQLRNFLISLSE
jgi:hypothetical protein